MRMEILLMVVDQLILIRIISTKIREKSFYEQTWVQVGNRN